MNCALLSRDSHQPLHAYDDAHGGNDVLVKLLARSPLCSDKCTRDSTVLNLHTARDYGPLNKVASTWGTLVAQVKGS